MLWICMPNCQCQSCACSMCNLPCNPNGCKDEEETHDQGQRRKRKRTVLVSGRLDKCERPNARACYMSTPAARTCRGLPAPLPMLLASHAPPLPAAPSASLMRLRCSPTSRMHTGTTCHHLPLLPAPATEQRSIPQLPCACTMPKQL